MSAVPPAPAARPAPSFIWPLALLAVLLATFAVVCIMLLSAARAYVGGESQWSRAQKTATHHLLRYAETRAPQDWDAYHAAIQIPLGDRRAREELDKPEPDLEVVRAGFLAGANHADDIAGMVRLYRWFRGVPFMARAIAFWTAGDAEIDALNAAAAQLHAAVLAGADSQALQPWREQVRSIDARLTPLEAQFSATLGEAARLTQQLLTVAAVLVTALLVG
ncbi:MAG: GGDEF domain-containing protein, partial [Rubrivivax sp.]